MITYCANSPQLPKLLWSCAGDLRLLQYHSSVQSWMEDLIKSLFEIRNHNGCYPHPPQKHFPCDLQMKAFSKEIVDNVLWDRKLSCSVPSETLRCQSMLEVTEKHLRCVTKSQNWKKNPFSTTIYSYEQYNIYNGCFWKS